MSNPTSTPLPIWCLIPYLTDNIVSHHLRNGMNMTIITLREKILNDVSQSYRWEKKENTKWGQKIMTWLWPNAQSIFSFKLSLSLFIYWFIYFFFSLSISLYPSLSLSCHRDHSSWIFSTCDINLPSLKSLETSSFNFLIFSIWSTLFSILPNLMWVRLGESMFINTILKSLIPL